MVERLKRVANGRAGYWCAVAYGVLTAGLAPFVLMKWV